MSTQRSAACARSTRRGVLVALGTGLTAGLGGCARVLGSATGDGSAVSILAAGSLQLTLDETLREATSAALEVETHGSVTAARLVASGRRDPDVLALADPLLFEDVVDAAWHAAFATNALVVATADSPGGRAVAEAPDWFDPVLAREASLGRTDPDLDPLGYRTVLALQLAAERRDRPDVREKVLDPSQVYPETSLLSRFETGDLDAAVVYRSMAVERGYDYRDLPAAVDLSDPEHADRYRTVSYALDGGTVVRGAPISYAALARRTDDRVLGVFERLVDGAAPADHGFDVPETYPDYRGSVPAAVQS